MMYKTLKHTKTNENIKINNEPLLQKTTHESCINVATSIPFNNNIIINPFLKMNTSAIKIITMRLGKFNNTCIVRPVLMEQRQSLNEKIVCRLDTICQQQLPCMNIFKNLINRGIMVNAFKIGDKQVIDLAFEQLKKDKWIEITLQDKFKFYDYLMTSPLGEEEKDFEFAQSCANILCLSAGQQIDYWSKTGRLNFLKLAFRKHDSETRLEYFLSNWDIILDAASTGKQLIIEWWDSISVNYKRSKHLQELACSIAAQKDHIDLVRWLLSEKKFASNDLLCSGIAECGNLDFLKECRSLGHAWTSDSTAIAAKKGHLDVLVYLVENGCPYNANTCANAAEGGQFECLKYLKSKGCNWNSSTLCEALKNNHIGILIWALDNGCPTTRNSVTSSLISDAIKKNDINLLKIFKQYNFMWDECTFSKAVLRGSVEMVQYLGTNGCPFNKNICVDAASSLFLGVFQYCIEYTNYEQTSTSQKTEIYLKLRCNRKSELLVWYKTTKKLTPSE